MGNNFSRGHPDVLLRFNNIIVFESEHNKQYLTIIFIKVVKHNLVLYSQKMLLLGY